MLVMTWLVYCTEYLTTIPIGLRTMNQQCHGAEWRQHERILQLISQLIKRLRGAGTAAAAGSGSSCGCRGGAAAGIQLRLGCVRLRLGAAAGAGAGRLDTGWTGQVARQAARYWLDGAAAVGAAVAGLGSRHWQGLIRACPELGWAADTGRA